MLIISDGARRVSGGARESRPLRPCFYYATDNEAGQLESVTPHWHRGQDAGKAGVGCWVVQVNYKRSRRVPGLVTVCCASGDRVEVVRVYE